MNLNMYKGKSKNKKYTYPGYLLTLSVLSLKVSINISFSVT